MKTPLKQPVALLLDLDGTLVDSAPDIAAALDATLSACGLPLAGIDNTRAWVGGGAPKLVARALAALDPAGSQDHETVLAMLLEHYATQNGKHGAPYAGVTRTLRDCHDRGLLLACVTNKPAGLAEALLEQYGVADCFRFTIGGDTLATKKPDPLPVTEACRQLGTEAKSAWMIGDSGADAGAAHAAGTPFVWVNYGYHRGDTATSLRAHATLARFDELIQLLDATHAV